MIDLPSDDTPLASLTLGQLLTVIRANGRRSDQGCALVDVNAARAADKRKRVDAARAAVLASLAFGSCALKDLCIEHRAAFKRAAVVAAVHELRAAGAVVLNAHGQYALPVTGGVNANQ